MYTELEVLDYVREEDVKFIRLTYFDVTGKQKNVSIMADQLERVFKLGAGIDASSIYGLDSANNADLLLHPDPATLVVLPWRPTTGKVVRMFCDIRYPDGTPYEKDFRFMLKQAVKKARKEFGIEFEMGSETEFYLFKLDENGNPTNIPFDNAGYMDIAPEDKGENIRREICFTLEQMGINPQASHHESGPGQNEIDFHYSSPLRAADETQTFKWVVRTRAASAGLYADFSPKPFLDKPGSGMHINISCSDKFEQCLAGILAHINDITFFLNPTENSYNRLGECKAPKFIAYGKSNRSTCISIPPEQFGKRIELRSPDSECNPYLAYTLLIYAALDGITKDMKLPDPIAENLFSADSSVTKNLETLPDTLGAAYKIAINSDFVKGILNSDILNSFSL